MSHYPLVKFVDSPAVGATVRLDLNDGSATAPRRVEAGFDLGVPTLEGDPDAVGQVFGFRSPRFTVQVKGTKANALAFVSSLSKEVLRRTNWLMFQLNATTSPVWFKVYRTGYQPLSLEQVYGDSATGGSASAGFPDVWRVDVPLVAEAFVYAARVAMSTFQVIQGPVDLAGPTRTAMRVVLPAIKGDAPTKLRVSITPAGVATTTGIANEPAPAWLIGCIAGKSTMSDLVIDIGTGDGFTAGTGMGAAVNDVLYFGGSYRALATTSPALQSRLTGSLPVVPPGRYKILVRQQTFHDTVVDKTFLFRIRLAATTAALIPGSQVSGLSVPLYLPTAAGTVVARGWIDLGDFNLPADLNVPRDSTDTLPAANSGGAFSLDVGTSDGLAGQEVRLDSIKLIPVDGITVDTASTLKTSFTRGNPPQTSGTTLVGVFDGDTDSYWATVSSLLALSHPEVAGSYPIADPASQQNLLIVMATNHGRAFTSAVASTTSLNSQAAVDVSYHPRYLHVGDGT